MRHFTIDPFLSNLLFIKCKSLIRAGKIGTCTSSDHWKGHLVRQGGFRDRWERTETRPASRSPKSRERTGRVWCPAYRQLQRRSSRLRYQARTREHWKESRADRLLRRHGRASKSPRWSSKITIKVHRISSFWHP